MIIYSVKVNPEKVDLKNKNFKYLKVNIKGSTLVGQCDLKVNLYCTEVNCFAN